TSPFLTRLQLVGGQLQRVVITGLQSDAVLRADRARRLIAVARPVLNQLRLLGVLNDRDLVFRRKAGDELIGELPLRRASDNFVIRAFLPDRGIGFAIVFGGAVFERADFVGQVQNQDDVGRVALQVRHLPRLPLFQHQQVFRLQVVDVIPIGIIGDDRHGDLARLDSGQGFFTRLLFSLRLAARLGEGRERQREGETESESAGEREREGVRERENRRDGYFLCLPLSRALALCSHNFYPHSSIQSLGAL